MYPMALKYRFSCPVSHILTILHWESTILLTVRGKMSVKPEYSKVDLSSLSNPSEVISTHVKLVWDLNFEKKEIKGYVEHTVKVLVEGSNHVDFDSSKLNLTEVVLINNEIAFMKVLPEHPILGSKIEITIPSHLQKVGSVFTVKIEYSVGEEASAVQWLDAAATKGGTATLVILT